MKLSFRMKILIPVIAAVVISFLAVGLIVYNSFHNEIDKLAKSNAWNVAYRYANVIQGKVNQAVNTAEAMDSSSGFLSGIGRDNTIDYLMSVLSDNGDLFAVWIVWEPGVFSGTDSAVRFAPMVYRDGGGLKVSEMKDIAGDRYTAALKTGKAYITEAEEHDYDGRKVKTISVSKPFKVNGRYAGVAGVDIDADAVIKLVRTIKVYQTGYGVLLSQNLINTVHPSDGQLGKRSAAADVLKPSADKKEVYSTERVTVATGKLSLSFYVPVSIEGTDYTYYFGINVAKEEVYEALDSVRVIVPVVALIAVLLISAVVIYIVRGLMRQLGGEPNYVAEIMNDLAGGNFTVDIKTALGDESSLAHSVKEMVKHLSGIISGSIKIAGDLQSSSTTLSAGVQELSAGMTDQSDRSALISSASEEMSATTGEIARSLAEISEFSQQTSEKVSSGSRRVEESVKEIVKIKDTVDQASVLVKSLGDKSLEIKNIVGVITNIADQTNLLALNAAIEAARAGDAGRGFAVVADEVRKLAENTQKATSEIAELVSGTQREMQNVSNSMESVIGQVANGVSASSKTTEVLGEIQQGVSMLQSMVESISAATRQMSATSSQIQSDISSVATISSEVKLTSDHLARNASELEKTAEVMKNMMSRFRT